MIELSYFDLGIIVMLVVTTMVVTPLAIRYGIPDKEEN